ncbi:hypothetical protein Droror1_Dr00015289 [Drosera rotundifolia]
MWHWVSHWRLQLSCVEAIGAETWFLDGVERETSRYSSLWEKPLEGAQQQQLLQQEQNHPWRIQLQEQMPNINPLPLTIMPVLRAGSEGNLNYFTDHSSYHHNQSSHLGEQRRSDDGYNWRKYGQMQVKLRK